MKPPLSLLVAARNLPFSASLRLLVPAKRRAEWFAGMASGAMARAPCMCAHADSFVAGRARGHRVLPGSISGRALSPAARLAQ